MDGVKLYLLPLGIGALEETKKKIVCKRCGACCKLPGGIKIGVSDVQRLSHAFGIRGGEFIRRYGMTLKSPCPFWEDGCTVYENRPIVCRTYPLYILNGQLGVWGCPAGKELITLH